jgi:DNA helicase-2/ATP-dependent DNA helicase PcrA
MPDSTTLASAQPAYCAGLNAPQLDAVLATEGPVLVLAGAGTGKTRVLVTRLIHILASRLAWPSQVLAVTFTNKAAREMKERAAQLLGQSVEGLWLGTFHAIAARMLRRHAELVGLKPNFTILDEDDQIRLLKQLLSAENVDDKRWPARLLSVVIQRWKDRALGPEQISSAEAGDLANGKMFELYRAYQARLRTLNAVDFGDLLLHMLNVLRRDAEVLGEWRRRFKYVMVDEYQDTNVCQHLWLRLLAGENGNLCCVGDDDQSIYGWRGAEVGNILRFERDYPGAKIVRLERNYRSTPHILGAASGLIAHNAGRLGKTLWTDIAEGEKVKVRGFWDGDEEARAVGDDVEAFQARRESPDGMAILVRASFQTRAFEERFMTLGVPYRVIGGLRFYERAEIKDAIAYLRVVHQPDDDLAFERIVNVPKRGLGDAALQTVHRAARAGSMTLARAAASLAETEDLKPKPRKSLGELMAQFERWRDAAARNPAAELAEIVLDESGYTAMLQADKSPDAAGRLDNLKEFVRAVGEFESLGGFLEHVSLVMDNERDAGEPRVSLMTLHAAKGLEFDTVFLPGWEDGLFPHQRSLDEEGAAGLEEERRLAYVGLTRARKRALVSFAANRRVHDRWQAGLPSRFLSEMPDEHVERVVAPGLYGGGRSERFAGPVPFRAEPRWQEARGLRPPPTIEARARRVEPRREDGAFRVGDRITHETLGRGQVLSVEGNKLGIAFEKGGVKKVLSSFVAKAAG